jgi:CheY-like chemotaxis protein
MSIETKQVLWVDDEIDLLRAHIIFLGERGYEVMQASNGEDAISLVRQRPFDIVLLDEMMAGRDGLSTLAEIKSIRPNVPIVMITKSEEEQLMDAAIGQRIDDYLTKPVNPSQILSACKKLLDSKRILEDRAPQEYAADAARIRSMLAGPLHWLDWIDIHVRLSEWDLEVERFEDPALRQMHADQRRACNVEFGKYVEEAYPRWLAEDDPPILSVDVIAEHVFPLVASKTPVFFAVIDCLRLDHWLEIEPLLGDFFEISRDFYYSILPSATPYARNALFSGLFPKDIAEQYPQYWSPSGDDAAQDELSRNRYEHQLLDEQLGKMGIRFDQGTRYVKVLDIAEGRDLVRRIGSFESSPLSALVFNFIDILAHGRSESEILQEIAPNDAAFRSLTVSWFAHSTLFEVLKRISDMDAVVVLTSDHGSILGTRGAPIRGDRSTTSNLRYKFGRNLKCDPRQAVFIGDPGEYMLPPVGLASGVIIAKEDYYFVYTPKFAEYQRQYRNSFQHGGISLEEMILPIVTMRPR